MRGGYYFLILSYLVIPWPFCIRVLGAVDTLRAGQALRDLESLESSNKRFKLLFFSTGDSNRRYLGIQHLTFGFSYRRVYTSGMKLIWVANRENSLIDSSGVLNITKNGYLVLTESNGTLITFNPHQLAKSSNTSLTLLNSGNLVFREGEDILWQSFDYPSDTWLPGMKLGLFKLDSDEPQHRFLTSYVSQKVPAMGAFTLGIDPNNTKQIVIWRRGVVYWRSGIWNSYNFTYFPNMFSGHNDYSNYRFSYFSDNSEKYFTYTREDKYFTWIEMSSSGDIWLFSETDTGQLFYFPSLCTKQPDENSKGCATPDEYNCKDGNAFNQTIGDMSSWEFTPNSNLGLSDCEEMCKRDCSCTAFASASSDGSACKISHSEKADWFRDLIIYIRINSSLAKVHTPPDHGNDKMPNHLSSSRKRWLWLIIGVPAASVLVLIPISFICYMQLRNRNTSENMQNSYQTNQLVLELSTDLSTIEEFSNAQMTKVSGKKDYDLPLFSLQSIEIATCYFSDANKIGQGGFGPVYKGKFDTGQEIAVKRLSRNSGQGLEEFKNEVILISKLQHRNLVRLLGCCIEREERILIYEYMPNGSLDSFLFDATKRPLIDWQL